MAASLLLAIEDESKLSEELAPWQDLSGEQLTLNLGPLVYPANLFTRGPRTAASARAHWVQFVLDNEGRELLADLRQPAFVAANTGGVSA